MPSDLFTHRRCRMAEDDNELQDISVELSPSECYPCDDCDVILPDGASALADALGALALKVIHKTGTIEYLDAETLNWRKPGVRDARIAAIKG